MMDKNVNLNDIARKALLQSMESRGWRREENRDIKDEMESLCFTREHDRLYVAVRSSLYPTDPGFLTPEEKDRLEQIAQREGAKASLARVWLDKNMHIKDGRVMWSELH